MKISIDFDNTIICYDRIFNQVGIDLNLIPKDLPEGKNNVRNYLRAVGKENEWIEMQGYVYGQRLGDAEPYEGVKKFTGLCT